MEKKIVIITAIFLFFISGYFSQSYFAQEGNLTFGNKISLPSLKYVPPSGEKLSDFSGPKTEACPINGQMLTKGHKVLWEKRRPLGIMIENHLDSRPQSGLTSADVVYEAVAEGGITRFLAIYYCQEAKYVGPVRSARVYFIELLQGYGNYPLYAHVGGANTPGKADALGLINNLGWGAYNDLNQFSVAFPTFWRDYERNKGVATEHTMYSTTARLWDYAQKNRQLTDKDEDGISWDKSYKPWRFKDDNDEAGNVIDISFPFWEGKSNYSVTWKYNRQDNSYLRSHGDSKPHLDKNNDQQIKAKNVIVALMAQSSANDGYPGGHLLYKTTGQGNALIFQDGKVIDGTWQRAKKTDLIRFYDPSGKEVSLNRGQTWVEIVPQDNNISY